jgi:hypothetical protein
MKIGAKILSIGMIAMMLAVNLVSIAQAAYPDIGACDGSFGFTNLLADCGAEAGPRSSWPNINYYWSEIPPLPTGSFQVDTIARNGTYSFTMEDNSIPQGGSRTFGMQQCVNLSALNITAGSYLSFIAHYKVPDNPVGVKYVFIQLVGYGSGDTTCSTTGTILATGDPSNQGYGTTFDHLYHPLGITGQVPGGGLGSVAVQMYQFVDEAGATLDDSPVWRDDMALYTSTPNAIRLTNLTGHSSSTAMSLLAVSATLALVAIGAIVARRKFYVKS